jgi:hypothetical protein
VKPTESSPPRGRAIVGWSGGASNSNKANEQTTISLVAALSQSQLAPVREEDEEFSESVSPASSTHTLNSPTAAHTAFFSAEPKRPNFAASTSLFDAKPTASANDFQWDISESGKEKAFGRGWESKKKRVWEEGKGR